MADIAFWNGLQDIAEITDSDYLLIGDVSENKSCRVTVGRMKAYVGIGGGGNIPVAGIALNSTQQDLENINDTFQLVATVLPSNATNKGVAYTSSFPELVSVSSSGLIRRMQNSTFEIVITTSTTDGGYVATTKIPANIVNTISLSPTNTEFDKNRTTLPGLLYTDVAVTISGDNKAFDVIGASPWVTVDVSEMSAGKFRVSVNSTNETGAYRENLLTVQSRANSAIKTTFNISQRPTAWGVIMLLDRNVINLDTAGKESGAPNNTSRIYFQFEGTSDKSAQIESNTGGIVGSFSFGSDATGAYVDLIMNPNTLTDVRVGSIVFSAVADSSVRQTLTINQSGTGIVNVTLLGLTPTTYTFTAAGQTLQLQPTVHPVNATDKRVTYASNNTAVATVNSAGIVTCVAPGAATITATTVDGGFTDTCLVTLAGASDFLFEGAPLSIDHPHSQSSGAYPIEIVSTLNGNPQGFTAVSSDSSWLQIVVEPQYNTVRVFFMDTTPGVSRSGTVTITQNDSGKKLVANCRQFS